MLSDFLAHGCGGDLAIAPRFNSEREPQRSVSTTVLNLAQPACAGRAKAQGHRGLFEGQTEAGAMLFEGRHGPHYSRHVKTPSSAHFHTSSTDDLRRVSHDVNMAAPTGHDWYLREWFAVLGKKQRDLITGLDYQPAQAHRLWHSLQPYRRDNVEEISAFLNIAPYELLMPPEEAMALRRLRSAIAEVAKAEPVAEPVSDGAERTGTEG